MYIFTARLVRFLAVFLFVSCFSGSFVLRRNQVRFQRHLASHYITFDDFPPAYANTLRSKNWDGLRSGQFDYDQYFPKPNTSNATNRIPPIIHFIWFKDLYSSHLDISTIPSTGSRAPSLCEQHNPHYTINIWNETASRDLLETHYAWFIPTYNSYKYPIQRIDALKYFILWHYGGVYMDMDISCRRPLDPLLQFPAWFAEASPMGVNNDLIASRPRHPVMALVLENLGKRGKRDLVFPYLTIFWSTGPQFLGDMLKRWVLERSSPRKDDKLNPDSWAVLPQEFYSEEYTFFGHSPGGTWHGEDVAVILWLVRHPSIIGFLLALIASSCLAPLLLRRRRKWWVRLEETKPL